MTIPQAIELAMQHHRAGNLREAESIYRQVLAQDPRQPDALHLLGVIARQKGNYELALTLIEQAISIHPHAASFHANLCDVFCMLNRFENAIEAARRAISIDPNFAAGHSNLGTALEALGRVDEAQAAYRAAIAVGGTPAAHNNLGAILLARGDLAGAIGEFSAALRLDPNFRDAKLNLAKGYTRTGRQLQDAGHFAEAVAAHRQAISLQPDSADAFNNLGNSLNSLRQNAEAEAAYRRAIALDPSLPEPYCNLGTVLHDRNDHHAAIEDYQNAIRLNPEMAAAYTNLGNALAALGRLDEARVAAEKAVALWPTFPPVHANLGNILREQGKMSEAVAAFQVALRHHPDFSEAHSNLVYTMQFQDDCDPRELLVSHRDWAARHANHLTAAALPHANDHSPDRRLKIGYVSPDFRMHPVAQFLKPLLANRDGEHFHITCYSDVGLPDAHTAEIRALADDWREVHGIADAQLAEIIRNDRIDILVDLTLHSANNRLLAFARKPAPLQVTYLGYPGTTGLSAMDYRLTDPHLDPPEAPQPYVERPLTLRSYWCYAAHPDSPPVAPLPSESSGRITFGSLNSFAKVSPRCLQTWVKILDAVPNSRLLIYAAEGEHRQRLREIVGKRVDFVSRQYYGDYLTTYDRIDVALDPFPYAGGTTTCDALWMGAPVITLAGKIAVHRSGVSLLTNVGLPELIATTPEDYVKLAVDLANDRTRLRDLRNSLRQQMMDSPLMDAKSFSRDVEAAFRAIWREWCRPHPNPLPSGEGWGEGGAAGGAV